MARAPVSKTGGWGFETLRPCHAAAASARPAPPFGQVGAARAGRASWGLGVMSSSVKGAVLAKFDPAGFVREVRQEVARVTWPSRKETLITTGLVLALSALAALFFMVVDWIIGGAMRLLFGLGV